MRRGARDWQEHQHTVVWGLQAYAPTLHLEPYGNLDQPRCYGLDRVALGSLGHTSVDRRRDSHLATARGNDCEGVAYRRPAVAGSEAEGLRRLGALRCHQLVLPLQDPPPRGARFQRVQEVVGTLDLYLCRLRPERLWRERGSKTAAVVQASAWVSAPEPRAAVRRFWGSRRRCCEESVRQEFFHPSRFNVLRSTLRRVFPDALRRGFNHHGYWRRCPRS